MPPYIFVPYHTLVLTVLFFFVPSGVGVGLDRFHSFVYGSDLQLRSLGGFPGGEAGGVHLGS